MEVLINLSLSRESPEITHASLSRDFSGSGSMTLEERLEEQAKALAVHMNSPKVVRVLSHSLPHIEVRSLDVLTGKRMALADEMAWDDDGVTVEEDSDAESEIEDDDVSMSSNE